MVDADIGILERPRVVAVDYDGTLTDSGRPAADVLDALAATRAAGIRVVLVTGRILAELAAVFPDARQRFDAIVGENGAVVATEAGIRHLGTEVDRTLMEGLAGRGVEARAGAVIVACQAADEHVVLDEVTRLGLECQLVRNRGELMVLPSGINKGVGLLDALAGLGYSRHDTVAVGDAENDHSLLEMAGLAVAVANAVPSLRDHADVVLDEPDGRGLVQLLADLRDGGRLWAGRSRGQLLVGTDAAGDPFWLEARPANVLVAGGTGDGKSYLAGLLAEQLIDLDYSLIVIDPEGDHVGLGMMRRAVVVGGDLPPPSADTVVSLLQRSDTSIVVDLSGLTATAQDRYLRDFPAEIQVSRRGNGRPHWLFVDEAHQIASRQRPALGAIDPASKGNCLITWRPAQLPADALAAMDIVLAMTSPHPDDALVELTAAMCGQSAAAVAAMLTGPTGRVVVARRGRPARLVRLAARATTHFRHDHKYSAAGMPADRRFWFRIDADHMTGTTAANLGELEAELAHCDRAVIRHHASRRDFSRWVEEVFHDAPLAGAILAAERTITEDSPMAPTEAGRLALVAALRSRRPR